MYLYEQEPVFSSKTGDKLGVDFIKSGTICDFCGHMSKFDEDNYEKVSQLTYKIDDESGCEEYFYYFDLPKQFENVSAYTLFGNQPEYHFCDGEELDGDCSVRAIIENNNVNVAMRFAEARIKVLENIEDISIVLGEIE